MRHCYKLDGKVPVPCGPLEWAKSFEDGNRRVDHTQVGPLSISTVFLGLDHNYHREGPPILFETMIFGDSSDLDEYQTRCSTWDEAVRMHQVAVAAATLWVATADAAVAAIGQAPCPP